MDIELILDSFAAILCVLTAVVIGPLYLRANGTRPLLAGNLALLSLATVGVIMGIIQDESTIRYPLIRIFALLALLIPALILTHRKH